MSTSTSVVEFGPSIWSEQPVSPFSVLHFPNQNQTELHCTCFALFNVMMMMKNCHRQQQLAGGPGNAVSSYTHFALADSFDWCRLRDEAGRTRLEVVANTQATTIKSRLRVGSASLRFSGSRTPCPWRCAPEAPLSPAEDVKRDGSSRASGCGMAPTRRPAASAPSRRLRHVYRAPLKCICGLGTRVGSIHEPLCTCAV